MEKKIQYFQERDFQKGHVIEVLISHVESPHSFYVQRLGDHARYLSSLMHDMNKEYASAGNRGLIYKPQVGMPCAAKYTVDNRWYRAKIIDLPGKKMVEVFYVDYGNQEVLPWNSLRKLQPQFLRIAAQAIHCSMSDVVPKQQQWTKDVGEYIVKATSGKMLRMYVDEVQRLQLKVTLYHSQNEVDICINGLLVRDGFATSVGVSSSLVEYHKMDSMPFTVPPVITRGHHTKAPKKKPILNIKPQNIGADGDGPSQVISSQISVEEAAIQDPFRLEITVLNCLSPSCIYVTLLSQMEQIKSLMCELQEFYSNSRSHIDKWEVNNKCCAFSVRHKMWYRAIVVELLPDNQAKVFMKDFAEIETVPILNLQLLDPKFLQIRDGAIKCHLAGVQAAGDKNEWPTLACEYLNELIDKYHSIYITKKGDIEDCSLPVELWVKNIIVGGPLEPTKEEWVTLNSKLIDQGLAIPVRREIEPESIPSIQVLKELDEQSQEASKNSVSEWLKLSSQVEGSMKTESSDPQIETSNDYCLSDVDEPAVIEPTAVPSEINNWLPPVPIKKRSFRATPTFVDDECVIYLHDTERSSDTLTIIGNALHSRFKNSHPKPHDQYWFPNQLCIVQYHADKKWYRGKVLEVNDDDRTVKVKFIDYGNVEDCKASELRKNIYMTHIPIQCYRCSLHGIKPASEDGKWPQDTLDFIHTTIVEKQCFVVIKDEAKLVEPYEIKLIGPGNLDIGDLLVRMQFGIYVDGLDPDAGIQSDAGTEDASVIIENEEDQLNENEEDQLSGSEEFEDVESKEDNEVEEENELENKSVNEENVSLKDEKPSLTAESIRDTASLLSDEHVQWNELIEREEEKNQIKAKKAEDEDSKYKKLDLQGIETLLVEVTAILSPTELMVHPWKLENPMIAGIKEEFDKMSDEMQECAQKQPVIRKPSPGQPCCIQFTEDNRWYRGLIVALEEKNSRVKVQYIDYGNVEYLPADKVHVLKTEWIEIPVLGLRCKLWHIKRPQVWDPQKLFPMLMKCMFIPPLIAHIKGLEPVMEAELLTEDGSSLAYQPLLDEGLLIIEDAEEGAKAAL